MDARQQWQQDTAGELPRWEEEWRQLPQGINQERWCGWLSRELDAAAEGGETAYRHLLQLHCAGRTWAARTLQPCCTTARTGCAPASPSTSRRTSSRR